MNRSIIFQIEANQTWNENGSIINTLPHNRMSYPLIWSAKAQQYYCSASR